MARSTTTSVLTTTLTYTVCTVWSSSPLPASTTIWKYPDVEYIRNESTQSGWIEALVSYNVVHTFEPPTCWNHWECDSLSQPSSDIAGIGVIVAFLITAWTSLTLTLWTYFSGRVPKQYLSRVDFSCFGANSNRCSDDWKKTMEKVTIMFSDQQLVTGLAILIAGFLEAYNNDLDAHHWQFVIYLAWMSSTVHLITLSLLKDRLSQRPVLRTFRIATMILLSILLAIALFPQLKLLYYYASISPEKLDEELLPFWQYSRSRQGFPVRCFWNGELHALSRLSIVTDLGLWSIDNPLSLNSDAVISYLTLCTGYAWKFCQLIPASRRFMRKWFFAKPALTLENALKKSSNVKPSTVLTQLLIYCYVLLLIVTEGLESFMATIIFLLGTLCWGTLQLVVARRVSTTETHSAESKLTFGQLLPLLLLLQPLVTILEHITTKFTQRSATAVSTCAHPNPAPQTPINHNDPSLIIQGQSAMNAVANNPLTRSATLTSLIGQVTLLTVDEKVDKVRFDPVVDHVCHSGVFKATIWVWLLSVIGFMMTVSVIIGQGTDSIVRIVVMMFWVPSATVFILLFLACCLACSRRLR